MEQTLIDLSKDDIICALSTPPGMGAIAVARVSGRGCIAFIDQIYKPAAKGRRLTDAEGYTVHHGYIVDGEDVIDEVLASIFHAPHSYTGEDLVEISMHGSVYVQQKTIELLISRGARQAGAGEFTLRAFLNGKFDLSQAEGVADLIASYSKASHDLALQQIRGGFSLKIKELREKLVELSSLLELELDFSGEDVEFADRARLLTLLEELKSETDALASSFSLGNVMKHGIPVAIIGKPNVGKSTLLNAILNEEKAIVSEVPGTTRDYIEDVLNIGGIGFRFIDTAGLRHTTDKIESLGVERTYEKIRQAKIVLYVFDISQAATFGSGISQDVSPQAAGDLISSVVEELVDLRRHAAPDCIFIPVANKADLMLESPGHLQQLLETDAVFISAKLRENINLVTERLLHSVRDTYRGDQAIVSSARHYEALCRSSEALQAVMDGMNEKIPTDLLASGLRQALHHLGTITGQVTTEELLGNIFGKFCIGK